MIYIILPIFNEAARLETLITKIKNVLITARLPYTIIAVNDGSKDDSQQILERLSAVIPINIITHKMNRGLGETLRDGFEQVATLGANGDVAICMDADDTQDPGCIPAMIDKLNEGYDIVVASRYAKGGQQVGLSWNRRFFSRGANLLAKTCFPVKGLKDYSCGYRAYKVNIIQKAIDIYKNNFIELKGLGFTATPEILIKMIRLKASVAEVPLILRYDLKESSSKMNNYATIIGYLVLVVKNIGK